MWTRGARVLGVDLSSTFVAEARRILLESGGRPTLQFAFKRKGFADHAATLRWTPDGARLMFAMANATRLPVADESVRLALVLNLIDRVPDPAEVLAEAWRCVTAGGYLPHADPYDYNDETLNEEQRLYDLDPLFARWGGHLVDERQVAFPVRLGWSQNVQCYLDEVKLYRKNDLVGMVH